MCSLYLTHPSTRSLVVGAVGSYCTAPGEQWEWGCPVPCSKAPRQGPGRELGPLQVAVDTPYLGLFGDLNRQPYG